MILPLFRAKTVETDSYDAGLIVTGDFVYTPSYTNQYWLKFAAGYEIWKREIRDGFESYFAINPETLELFLDNGKTFKRLK